MLELYRSEESLPDREVNDARSLVASAERGYNVEVTSISPEYVRNVDFDIKLALDPRREHSTIAEQGLILNQIQLMSQIGGNRVNVDELLVKLATTMGLDPSKIINEDGQTPAEQEDPMSQMLAQT